MHSCPQEDTELDDQVRLMTGPEGTIRIVQLQKDQLSLKLWEPLCADNPNPSGPPLLLLPPEYEFLDAENGPRELAELMYIGMRVRALPHHRTFLLDSPFVVCLDIPLYGVLGGAPVPH